MISLRPAQRDEPCEPFHFPLRPRLGWSLEDYRGKRWLQSQGNGAMVASIYRCGHSGSTRDREGDGATEEWKTDSSPGEDLEEASWAQETLFLSNDTSYKHIYPTLYYRLCCRALHLNLSFAIALVGPLHPKNTRRMGSVSSLGVVGASMDEEILNIIFEPIRYSYMPEHSRTNEGGWESIPLPPPPPHPHSLAASGTYLPPPPPPPPPHTSSPLTPHSLFTCSRPPFPPPPFPSPTPSPLPRRECQETVRGFVGLPHLSPSVSFCHLVTMSPEPSIAILI